MSQLMLSGALPVMFAQEGEPPQPGLTNMLPGLIFIMVLFYFLILRPQRKKEQAMQQMIGNLKEKDRVVTIGGIHGVVTNVLRDRNEVTLRVDESTGTKLRVGMQAIARVVTEDEKTEN